MRKYTILLGFITASLTALSQDTTKVKQDTVIRLEMSLNQFRQVLSVIDQNIDSKSVSKSLLEYLSKSATMVQPVDKPKEVKAKNP